jgi:hypothetical protein
VAKGHGGGGLPPMLHVTPDVASHHPALAFSFGEKCNPTPRGLNRNCWIFNPCGVGFVMARQPWVPLTLRPWLFTFNPFGVQFGLSRRRYASRQPSADLFNPLLGSAGAGVWTFESPGRGDGA